MTGAHLSGGVVTMMAREGCDLSVVPPKLPGLGAPVASCLEGLGAPVRCPCGLRRLAACVGRSAARAARAVSSLGGSRLCGRGLR